MKRNYSKLISVTLILVLVLTAFVFPTPVYAGAKVGVWMQVQVAIYSESSGYVDIQIEGDNEAYIVEPGTKLFVVIQADFTSESKQQEIGVSWREWGTSTWAIASPKTADPGSYWKFWNSEYDTKQLATNHFGSLGSVYIEDSTSDGGSPKGLEEFWFVVEAPTTEARYELAISQNGVAEVDEGTIVQQIDITVATPPPDISNTPTSYGFGTVAESSTTETGLTYFTVTNNSAFAVNITIGGTDMTGGTTWTLSNDGSAGNMIYGLNAGLEGGSYNVVVRRDPAYNTLVSGLAGGETTQQWGLQFLAPSTMSDGASKSGTVTLTATQD